MNEDERPLGLVDTQLSNSAEGPGEPQRRTSALALAVTRASDGARAVTPGDAALGTCDTLDSREPGALARPEFRDPEELRRKQALKARLFGEPEDVVKIGRYRVLERIGAGGMGVVYAAYDERLDRKVAVKVLRPESAGSASRIRLVREAQAMARLSHPNFVVVHEVGEDRDEVFVAMEFVRGQSLDAWLGERRPWREVLAAFLQAGRGLQAAHAAGLVHRDFKPGNAILGADGRVKVLDFGLARAEIDGEPPDPGAQGEGSLMAVRLTRTGAMVGTPVYMSPEQLLGGPGTAASDQFAFFVALYEGLFGALPFAASSLGELVRVTTSAPPADPPAGSDVPSWVRQVIWRGLEKDPTRRFSDMGAALAALERDPSRRRRQLALVAGLMLVSAGASAALFRGAPQVGRCEGLASAVERVWEGERVAAARAAFAAQAGSLGAETWALIEPRLSAWVSEWTQVRGDRCRDHAAGRLSDTLHDRSVACLERQVARLDALMSAFVRADERSVDKAPIAVGALPTPGLCADTELLLAEVAPPEDPVARAAVARGREALEQARASLDLGDHAGALEQATGVAGEARALGHEALLAAAEAVRGDALQWARDVASADAALSAAVELGLANGDDGVAAEALARRIFVRSELAGEPERALADAPIAGALVRRSGSEAHLAWLLHNNVAGALHRRGRYDDAEREYREALRFAEEIAGGDAVETVYTQYNLGILELQRTHLERASTALATAVTAAERVFGANHPTLVPLLEGEAGAAFDAGRMAEARAGYERARRLAERSAAPNPALLLPIVEMQARIAGERRAPEAVELADRAADLAFAAFGAEHPRRALALLRPQVYRPERSAAYDAAERRLEDAGGDLWLGGLQARVGAAIRAGRADEALSVLARTRARPAWRDVSADWRAGLGLLEADALLALDRTQEAAAALDGIEASGSELSPAQRQRIDYLRGRIAEAADDHADAVRRLRRAASGYAATYDEDHPEYAEVRLALARSLRAAGERKEADALAREVLAAYRSLGPGFAPEVAEVERLLAR